MRGSTPSSSPYADKTAANRGLGYAYTRVRTQGSGHLPFRGLGYAYTSTRTQGSGHLPFRGLGYAYTRV